MPGDCEPGFSVAHDHMAALAGYAVAELLKYSFSVVLADSRNSGHRLYEHVCLLHALQPCLLDLDLEPEANCLLDIPQSFPAVLPL